MTDGFDAAGYLASARSLREKHQLDEAEVVLAEGIGRYPDQAGLLADYASLAQDRRAWLDALERWDRLRRDFPNDLRAYVGASLALREMQRHDEAEALLSAAIELFPDHPHPYIHYASLAQLRGDLPEAILRWARVRQNFPAETVAYVHAAVALRDLNRLDEADALLREAIERFPDRREPLLHHAVIAERRRDWAEALRQLRRVREQFPDDSSGYLHAAAILRQLERFDESETLLGEALERFPSDRRVFVDAADLATQRKDWVLALARWQNAQRRFPDDPHIDTRIHFVQMRMLEADPNTVASSLPDVAIASARQGTDDEAPRRLTTEPPTAVEPKIGATKQDQSPQIKPGRVSRVLKSLSSRLRGAGSDASRR